MNEHPHETLDETIDRVAAGVTYASADPALVARIQAGVRDSVASGGARHVDWWRLAMPAAGVAAVVLFAFLVLPGNSTSPEPVHVAVAPVPPAPIATSAPAPVVEAVAELAIARRPRRQRSMPFEPQIPQIKALSSPALLAVDTITEDQLTIAPVGVASLGLANLALTDADRRDDPKE